MVESRFRLTPWGRNLLSFRSYRTLAIIGLTLLIVIPLYQLSDHDAASYYRQYVSDPIHSYFDDTGVYNNTLYQEGTEDVVHPTWNFSTPCDNFPNTEDILLVMKTGATEAFDKLPTQLLTSMQCLPDFLIFSDLEQQIGRYHIHDALADVNATFRDAHNEFDLYKAQQDCPISQKECTADLGGGWNLDKFKFLHMVVKTWEMRPGMQWYVFAEADTYVFWNALVDFLRHRAQPQDYLYVGSVAMLGGFPFAHGGSGYVMSGPLIQKIAETIPDVAAKYDERGTKECCGDLLMALASDEVGTKVKQAHPMFNGEKPNTLPYGPGHWCEPLLTMHHMNSEEVAMVWQYEQTRTTKAFAQIQDMYHTFMAPHLVPYRDEWDNHSDDLCYVGPSSEEQERVGGMERDRQKKEEEKNAVERLAHQSPDACSWVCESAGLDFSDEEFNALETDQARGDFLHQKYDEKAPGDHGLKNNRKCFQWRFHKGGCCVSRSFKLGTPKRERNEEDNWTSGWFVRGIYDWIDVQPTCKEPAWKELN